MKKIILMTAAVALGVLFGAARGEAQVSTQNVLKRSLSAIEKLEKDGTQVLFVQIDNVSKGQTSSQTYPLEGGSKYVVIAIGDDERIQDLDLTVFDEDGDEAGRDSDDSNVAVVKLSPKKTTRYRIAVKGYKMSRDDGFFGVIICRLD